MKVFFVCVTALISAVGKGQATDDLKPLATSSLIRLSISGNSHPIFLNGEEHSSFMVNYGVSRQTQLELQAFYDTYLMSKRFRTSLVDKLYLSDKQYLFSGLDLEMEVSKYEITPNSYRVGIVTGAGYDINANFMIEAKSIIQTNNSKMGLYGESLVPMPSTFIFRSKFKF